VAATGLCRTLVQQRSWPECLRLFSGVGFASKCALKKYGWKWPQGARIVDAWLQIWTKVVSGSSFGAFGAPGRRYGRKYSQEAHLEHFGRLATDMGESDLRRLIWSIWEPGRRYGWKWSQQAHLEHFERLAADMGKSGPRRLIWSILDAWLQIWAKVVSAGSFGAFWAAGRVGPNSMRHSLLKPNSMRHPLLKTNGMRHSLFKLHSTRHPLLKRNGMRHTLFNPNSMRHSLLKTTSMRHTLFKPTVWDVRYLSQTVWDIHDWRQTVWDMAADMGESGFRRLIWSILGAWPISRVCLERRFEELCPAGFG